MTKKTKLILTSIIVAVVVVAVAIMLVWWFTKDNEKPVEQLPVTNQNAPENNTEDVVVYDLDVLYGLKDEYYQGETLDITTIKYRYSKYVNNRLEYYEDRFCTEASIKREYYESLPNTKNLGEHTFVIVYLNTETTCTYNVVEYAEKHHIGIMASDLYVNGFSPLSTLINAQIEGAAGDFVEDTYFKLLGQNDGYGGPLRYLNHIDNVLDNCDNPNMLTGYDHPTNSDLKAFANKSNDKYVGKFYVEEMGDVQEIAFELYFYKENKGVKLVINAHGNTYTILSNSTDNMINVAVIGAGENDILINTNEDKHCLAVVTAGQNNEIYTEDSSLTFANDGLNYIVWDIETETYVFE